MKKFAVSSAVALIVVGSVGITQAEARDGRHGALAAGVIGGLAVGALVGSAASGAYAAPAPAYAPVYAPTYSYDYAPAPVYRTERVVRSYAPVEEYEVEYVPRRAYRTTRVVRTYEYDQPGYYGGW